MKNGMISRRNMIKTGLGTAALSGITLTGQSAPRERASGREPMRIGVILGEWSHCETAWARLINGVPNVNDVPYTPKMTSMYITHVWHIFKDKAEEFARKYKVDYVDDDFDDMAGKVDGVIIDTLFQTPWTYKLARPFLEAGTPVYIDRPFTDAMWKLEKMLSLSKRTNTPVWSGSSLEFMELAGNIIRHNPPESINGYEIWSEGVPDYYSHGVHGLWWAYRIAGGGINSISHKTEAWNKGGGTSVIRYKDRGKGEFTGTIHDTTLNNCLLWTDLKKDGRIYSCDYQLDWDMFVWTPMITNIEKMFAGGIEAMPDSYERLTEKQRLFLAGFRSILRENGGTVELDSLDKDWAAGSPWGQVHNPGRQVFDAYTKYFGAEKGEIMPDYSGVPLTKITISKGEYGIYSKK